MRTGLLHKSLAEADLCKGSNIVKHIELGNSYLSICIPPWGIDCYLAIHNILTVKQEMRTHVRRWMVHQLALIAFPHVRRWMVQLALVAFPHVRRWIVQLALVTFPPLTFFLPQLLLQVIQVFSHRHFL